MLRAERKLNICCTDWLASMKNMNSDGGKGTKSLVRLEIEKGIFNSTYIDVEMLAHTYTLFQ